MRFLANLHLAFYKGQSEATCCISIDLILIQYQKYIGDKYFPDNIETPPFIALLISTKNIFSLPAVMPRKDITLYSKSNIFVEVSNWSALNKKYLITSCTDWAFGYSLKDADRVLFAILKAKTQQSSMLENIS